MSVSTITVASADEARVVLALEQLVARQPIAPNLPLPGIPAATNGLTIGTYIAALLKLSVREHEALRGGKIDGPPPAITIS
jgi:hypothetical protein